MGIVCKWCPRSDRKLKEVAVDIGAQSPDERGSDPRFNNVASHPLPQSQVDVESRSGETRTAKLDCEAALQHPFVRLVRGESVKHAHKHVPPPQPTEVKSAVGGRSAKPIFQRAAVGIGVCGVTGAP